MGRGVIGQRLGEWVGKRVALGAGGQELAAGENQKRVHLGAKATVAMEMRSDALCPSRLPSPPSLVSGGPGAPGSAVGYHVRLDASVNADTQLLFCTTGILLRR